jgi:hypothetical protein
LERDEIFFMTVLCDNAVVRIAAPLIEQKAEIEALGWEVRVLDGLDHTGAMQAGAVLPVILPWLISRLNA